MIVAYRILSDLQDEGDRPWASYLNRRSQIERNSTTVTILHNIQNFYESFCRSGNEKDGENEAHFHRCNENVSEKTDDNDNDAVDLLDVQEQLPQTPTSDDFQNALKDPFVAELLSFSQNPLQLTAIATPQTVNPLNAAKAVGDLRPSTGRKKFQLPNRAKLGGHCEQR